VAGIFAFAPIQEATTVHTSGTTTLATGGIGVGDFATGAITADSVATDAVTEISGVLPRMLTESDTTGLTSVGGGTRTGDYTITADEIIIIYAIEVTGDITAFTDAGDTVTVTGFELDGQGLNNGGALTVNIGTDGAADTIEVFNSDWQDGGNGDFPVVSYTLTPNVSTGFEVSVVVTDFAGVNDGAQVVPITVTFYFYGSSTANASIALALS